MLPCPRCSVPLATHVARGAVHYVCPQCDGRAANIPLLRRTLEPTAVNHLWRTVCDTHPTDHHGALRCPSCRKMMHPAGVPCTDGGEIQLDVCRVCQIVWLDAGEIERLPQTAPETGDTAGKFTPEAAAALAPVLASHERRRAEQSWGDAALPGNNVPDHPLHALLTYLGFPMEEDAPAVRGKPWITWITAALCVLVTMAAFFAGRLDELVITHGFLPADPWRAGGFTAFSSFFIHGGILHLAFNMWFLILAGDNCEDLLGTPRYLALLAGGALVALLSHALLDPQPDIPVVGASGGISALLAFYALALPHVRLVVCLRLGWYPLWFRMRAATAVMLWVGGQVIGVFMQLGGLSHVSSIAHLGGALAGLALWLVLRRKAA